MRCDGCSYRPLRARREVLLQAPKACTRPCRILAPPPLPPHTCTTTPDPSPAARSRVSSSRSAAPRPTSTAASPTAEDDSRHAGPGGRGERTGKGREGEVR